jgi:hypothetical protein
MFQIKVVDEIKIHVLCSVTFPENRAVYQIISKNMVEPERPQMAIWQRFACWISEATRAQADARARHPHEHTRKHAHALIHACEHAHT